MRTLGWAFLLLVLTACSGATSTTYGGGSSGSGNGGFTNTTAPWHVTYKVDAVHTGSPPTDSNSPYAAGMPVTVLGQGNLLWDNFPFKGWTTVDPGYNGIGDNGGTHYNPGDVIPAADIHANITLWAAWANPN